MKRITIDERFTSRMARDRGDAPPLLTNTEQLEPVTLELLRKVDIDGEDITEVVINVPSVDDILDQQMNDPSKEQTLRQLAKVCKDITPDHIRAMHPKDFNRLSQVYWAYQE